MISHFLQRPSHRMISLVFAFILFVITGGLSIHGWMGQSEPPRLLDDRAITLRTDQDISERRTKLIEFIWGSVGWPTVPLPHVEKDDLCPLRELQHYRRIDTLTVSMEADQKSYAHHIIPKLPNGQLVILHHGHAPTFDDDGSLADRGYGMRRTIEQLLLEGYAVLAVYMPHIVQFKTRLHVDDRGSMSHDEMFKRIRVQQGSVMKFFLEPLVSSLQYLKTKSSDDDFPNYDQFHMVGLSGGGWTTTVYAAIDPTIKLSFPVAGSIPLYWRTGGSIGDTEQTLKDFYQIAGYPELYVLGSHGPGRKQVQILNRRDDCCFGERQHQGAVGYDHALRDYERHVRSCLRQLKSPGHFDLEIDEAAPSHLISWHALRNIILPELNGSRPALASCDGQNAFVRGADGHLWHSTPMGWKDSGLPMIGSPAVVKRADDEFDLFYRSHCNQLMHATLKNGQWTHRRSMGSIVSDPIAQIGSDGRFDVIAFGTHYHLQHWTLSKNAETPGQPIVHDKPGSGSPAMAFRPDGSVVIMYLGLDRKLVWIAVDAQRKTPRVQCLDYDLRDRPTLIALPHGILRGYAIGQDGHLYEMTFDVEAFNWKSQRIQTNNQGIKCMGAVAALTDRDQIRLYASTSKGSLAKFVLDGNWSCHEIPAALFGPPIVTRDGVWARGSLGQCLFFDGSQWQRRDD